jgi:hypothetical protein
MGTQASLLNALTAIGSKITLIGMSGLGKSHWSKLLGEKGFKRFCCDNLIAERLFNTCDQTDSKVECLGLWMGFPFTPGYQEREHAYRLAEANILWELVAYLEASHPDEKVVIDTTGSAPYAGDALMKRLSELTHMVHLAASTAYVDEMTNSYIGSPRPVVWSDAYHKNPGETEKEALARCYKVLLAYRETLYQKYAHQSIPYHLHRR